MRELYEEAGIRPAGPVRLLTAVPLQGYGMHPLSLRYVCRCDDGDVRLSHEHSDWAWTDPRIYRATHLSDAEIVRWGRSSPEEAFNVWHNRNGLDDYLRWRTP